MSRLRGFRLGGGRAAVVVAVVFAALSPVRAGEPEAGPPFLWKIEGAKAPSWIFGTIHLARPDVTALPDSVSAALSRADAVYTETPMDSATMLALLPRLVLPAGVTLESVLGAKLTADLRSEYAHAGKNAADSVGRLRPWAAAVSLLGLDDQAKYPGALALDLLLYQRAAMAGKTVGGLETPDEQLSIFEDLSPADQAALVEDTLAQLRDSRARGVNLSDSLAALYLKGDLDLLVAELNKLDNGSRPELRDKLLERLLYRRNVIMTARIVKMLRGHPEKSFFIAVGAAHLQGDRGLLAALEKSGFHLTRAR